MLTTSPPALDDELGSTDRTVGTTASWSYLSQSPPTVSPFPPSASVATTRRCSAPPASYMTCISLRPADRCTHPPDQYVSHPLDALRQTTRFPAVVTTVAPSDSAAKW